MVDGLSPKKFSDDVLYIAGVIPGLSVESSIRRIMLVGAKTKTNHSDALTDRDRGHLYAAFHAAAQLNIPLHSDFDIDVVNIHPAYGGRSFLKETAQADRPVDMVVLCFVFNPDPADRPAVPYHADLNYGDRFIDEQQSWSGVWHDSAVRVGAKIVTTITGNAHGSGHITEINHRHFVNVANSQYVQRDNFEQHNTLTTLCRRDFL